MLIVDIPGANAANNITFQSSTGDSTSVLLTYGSSGTNDNYIIKLYGADHITFKTMSFTATGVTYGRIIQLFGYAHNNSISNNIFNGSGTASSTDNRTIIYSNSSLSDTTIIENNIFNFGSRGIHIIGISSSETAFGYKVNNNLIFGG